MQQKLESLAAQCNELALLLSKSQFANYHQTRWNSFFCPQTVEDCFDLEEIMEDSAQKTTLDHLRPSEMALEMVGLAVKISKLLETRFTLIGSCFKQTHADWKPKKDESIMPFNLDNAANLKEDQEWRPQPCQPSQSSQKSESLSKLRLKREERSSVSTKSKSKRSLALKLVQEIKKMSSQFEVTLHEFKKSAIRIFTSKKFRPTEDWCLNFVKRHSLQRCVSFYYD